MLLGQSLPWIEPPRKDGGLQVMIDLFSDWQGILWTIRFWSRFIQFCIQFQFFNQPGVNLQYNERYCQDGVPRKQQCIIDKWPEI